MDIYDTKDVANRAPSRAELELRLIEEERKRKMLRGATSWIAEGLAIEEAQ